MHCSLCLFPISSLDKVFQWLFQTGFFLFGRQKKGLFVGRQLPKILGSTHRFTIQNLDLIVFLFWETKFAQHCCVLTDLSIFWQDGKKWSLRKVGLHFADFLQFELKRYVMKGKCEGNFQDVFFNVHCNGSAQMFLLQALG